MDCPRYGDLDPDYFYLSGTNHFSPCTRTYWAGCCRRIMMDAVASLRRRLTTAVEVQTLGYAPLSLSDDEDRIGNDGEGGYEMESVGEFSRGAWGGERRERGRPRFRPRPRSGPDTGDGGGDLWPRYTPLYSNIKVQRRKRRDALGSSERAAPCEEVNAHRIAGHIQPTVLVEIQAWCMLAEFTSPVWFIALDASLVLSPANTLALCSALSCMPRSHEAPSSVEYTWYRVMMWPTPGDHNVLPNFV